VVSGCEGMEISVRISDQKMLVSIERILIFEGFHFRSHYVLIVMDYFVITHALKVLHL
jgi:hypothetical protein